MKNLAVAFYTLFFSFSLPLYAQQDLKSYDLRISYEVDFQQDSTSQTKKQESMFLFVKDGNSFFQSANEYYKDSLMHRKEVYGESVNTGKYWSEFKFTINKTSSGDIRVVDAIDDNYFSYSERKDVFNWEMQTDTVTINGFPCQKAITDFGGREWIAWFTSEVPLSEGPYKFCGLPGLIVQISDTENHYIFSLTSVLNEKGDIQNSRSKKAVKTTKADFLKAVERYRSNPFDYKQQNGVVFTSGQEEIKKNIENYVSRRNNPIEISVR